jgi:hypothetical protein
MNTEGHSQCGHQLPCILPSQQVYLLQYHHTETLIVSWTQTFLPGPISFSTCYSPCLKCPSLITFFKKGQILFIYLFILWYWGLKLGRYSYPLSHSTSPFFNNGFFQDRISWTICLGWLWTVILLISASWAPRITGMRWRSLNSLFIHKSPVPNT